MEIDLPLQKFFEEYPCSKRTKEFLQMMMQGYTYEEIGKRLNYSYYYVQNLIAKYMTHHGLTRFRMMAKLYGIARDMYGLEESHEASTYQHLLRPDSVD